MMRAKFVAILCVLPAIAIAGTLENYDNVVGPGSMDRDELAEVVHVVMGEIGGLIEEISSLLPQEEAERRRQSHYEWQKRRDVECAVVDRGSDYELAEMDCRTTRTEDYFLTLKKELAALQVRDD